MLLTGVGHARPADPAAALTEVAVDGELGRADAARHHVGEAAAEYPFWQDTVVIGYCDYHPVTKSPKIGSCDYSQMSD